MCSCAVVWCVVWFVAICHRYVLCGVWHVMYYMVCAVVQNIVGGVDCDAVQYVQNCAAM